VSSVNGHYSHSSDVRSERDRCFNSTPLYAQRVSSKYIKTKLYAITDITVEDSPLLKWFPDCGLQCATALTGGNTLW